MQWKPCLVAGLGLGAVVVAWQFLSISLGATALFVPIAFTLQIVALVVLAFSTRHDHRYGQQLLAATVASAVASALIFGGSLLATTVVFPEALGQLRAATEAAMLEHGATEAEVAAALSSLTPFRQAWAGVVGTMISGPLIAALAAIGWRKRG